VAGAELDSFCDGLMRQLMSAQNVKGAAVAVVKDTAVALLRGYGTADIARGTDAPIVADRTLFRIGSTSKLLTATAAMQQVGRGALELDRDVNAYLPFRVPAMTLRNLLTHTAGLEENQFGWMMKEGAADLVPLEENVRAHIPAQVRQATTDFRNDRGSSYSNWAFALLGVLVSRVSGMAFDEYMDSELFRPLGMDRSTFREPLPVALAASMSKGHFATSEGTLDFEYWHSIGPAGSAATTASDMARFMLAHLRGGAGILSPAMAELMHGRAMTQHARVNGSGLCWYEVNQNGRRVLCHRGKGLCFQSDLSLIPGENAGVFIVLNTAIKSTDLRAAAAAFVDRYFPADTPSGADLPRPRTAARYAGTYRGVARAYESIERFNLLTCGERFESRATRIDGATLAITNLGGVSANWEEFEPGVFRRVGGQEQMVIVPDSAGGAEHMLGPFAFAASRRIRWYESRPFHLCMFAIGALGLAVAVAWWVAGIATGSLSPVQYAAIGLAALFGALDLAAFKILWDTIRFPPPAPLPFRYPRKVHWALTMVLASVPVALGVLGFAAAALLGGWWQPWVRSLYAAVAALELLFLFQLHHWKLVGYRYG
jgi:CubicO group peptidase (beta-lactamase class C family)